MYGTEKDYAMLVIADPIRDQEISDIISRYRRLGSQIHTGVRLTAGQSLSRGESMAEQGGVGMGISILSTVLGAIGGSMLGGAMASRIGMLLGSQIGGMLNKQKQASVNGSASTIRSIWTNLRNTRK